MFDFFNKKQATAVNEGDAVMPVELFRSIIKDLSDGLIAYDPDFKILIFNRAAERIFNISEKELVGQVVSLDRTREARLKLLAQVIFPSLAPSVVLHSEPGDYPQIADMHFDDLHLRVITNRILDASGAAVGFTKIIHDRSREISILKSKSEFLTIAAHQLRTPLTAISWSIEGLASEPSLSPQAKELSNTASLASKKLLKIVEDLLDVAKLEEGKFGYNFQELPFVEFTDKLLAEERVVADSYKINLYFDRPKDEFSLFFDPEKLALAITNLVDNAIKYNVPNGSVTVTISRLPNEPYILVSVKDTGLGIPKEAMDKLFTKFFRAENAIKFSTEGSGLGLYLVKNIITRHGGRIWAESEVNRGTTFYFTLSTDPKMIKQRETTSEDI